MASFSNTALQLSRSSKTDRRSSRANSVDRGSSKLSDRFSDTTPIHDAFERPTLTEDDSKMSSKDHSRPCSGNCSKRVHEPWYERYADVLIGDDKLLISQPYDEIAHEELDIAMKLKYGHHYKSIYAYELSDTRIKDQMEKCAMKFHSKLLLKKQSEYRSETSLVSTTSRETGPLSKYHPNIAPKPMESLWQMLTNNSGAKAYFGQSLDQRPTLRKELARKRFIRTAVLIMSLNRFKLALINNRYSLEVMLLELPQKSDAPSKGKRKDTVPASLKNNFDPTKYQHNKTDGEITSIPWPTVYTLTKPWWARDIDEVGEAVKILYPLLIPNNFPVKVQMQIAYVAWYTRLKKNRPISREGNCATCFKIVLSGQIVVTEVIKDRVVPKGKPKMRFVKYINAGETFGDHETEMLYRMRIYSAYSASTCEILTVDYDDYQENQRIYFNPVTEKAPQHIEFLKRLPLFNTISRKDLIRSARDNIQLVYFRNMQHMATSLRDSDFIFVVMTGQCHTVIKQKKSAKPVKQPPTPTTNLRRTINIKPNVTIASGAQTKGIKVENFQKRFYRDICDVSSCNFVKSWMTQEFVREIKRISERSLTISKEEAVKEIESLRLTRAVCDVYGHDFVHKVAADLVEKMHVHEVANREYEADIKRLKKQRVVLLRRLKRTLNEAEGMARLKDQIARASLKISGAGRSESTTQAAVKESVDNTKRLFSTVLLDNEKTAGKLSATGELLKRKFRTKAVFLSLLRAKSANKAGSFEFELDDIGLSDKFLDTGSDTKNTPISQSPREETPSACTTPIMEGEVGIEPNRKVPGKSTKGPPRRGAPVGYEYSAPVDLFIRGDTAGNNYVNYNDGKFRKPETDSILISNGTEVIVVRKSFLLERLYNHQSRHHTRISHLVTSDSDSN